MRNVGPSGSVQRSPFRQVGVADFDAEKARAATAAADFFFGGFAHAFDCQVQSDRDARQRVVAVEHHMLGVNLCHGVEHVARGIWVGALGQGGALDGHAFFQVFRKEATGFQKEQLVIEVAKGVFGLDLQIDLGAFGVALQGLFDFGQQVFASDQKVYGFVQGVERFTQCVFERPGQSDHASVIDFHRTIVAVWRLWLARVPHKKYRFPMNIDQPLTLLGGLTPAQFMKRHWHKKPLLVRQAIPNFKPCLDRSELVALAGQEGVESRLIVSSDKGWKMKHGPLAKRSLPPFSQKKWTFLVQGVDLHHDGVHALMQQFRFVPDARLDDLMISYATDGGGVGPHFDSYDVFLLQAHGQRRWRIGRQKDLSLQPGVPLKILQNFEHEEEFVLNPGDMLYLPPKYAHDGIAEGECMTWSIGFRSPKQGELARELLLGLADEAPEGVGEAVYRDPAQPAVAQPGAIPAELAAFARESLQKALKDPHLLSSLLGEHLTEPKANVWFDLAEHASDLSVGVVLDRRTRMMYDERSIFVNGESFRVGGKDAVLLRALADTRTLSAHQIKALSAGALAALDEWQADGWLKTL